MQFSPLELLRDATTPSVVPGMLRLLQAGTVTLFRAILVVTAIPAPEAYRGLLAVDSDVAEPLAVVPLGEAGLGFVCFDLYNDVMEVSKDEDVFDF